MTDNRAARRRQSAREMRALLEGFVAVDPLTVTIMAPRVGGGAYSACRYCHRRWEVTFDPPVIVPTDHADDCLWRYAQAWLAAHRPK